MSEQAIPTKCKVCKRPTSTPVFCDYCETLNPLPSLTDHFQLMGLPRRFEVDAGVLHDRYVALSRHTHPDLHTGEGPEVQALSLRISATVNDAYRTLRDPAARAGYLLELLGGPSSAQDKSVPEGFLGTMMMMQEELADAKTAGNQPALERLRRVLQTQQDGLMRRVAGLFGELDEASACEATRRDLLAELRRQLNAVAYVRKLMTQM